MDRPPALHLDHVGAELRQGRPAQRSGCDLGELQHSHTIEQPSRAHIAPFRNGVTIRHPWAAGWQRGKRRSDGERQMDFELTEEQQLLQLTARRIAREVVKPRAAEVDASAQYPED